VEEVEGFLRRESRRPCTERKDKDDDVEDQLSSGLQNTKHIKEVIDDVGGQNGRFNEAVVDLEEVGQCNVALKEGGDQRQTLTEIKSLYVILSLLSVTGPNFKH